MSQDIELLRKGFLSRFYGIRPGLAPCRAIAQPVDKATFVIGDYDEDRDEVG